jgi:type III pantothenate kinase
MLIALDIGNSTITMGIFIAPDLFVKKIGSFPRGTAREYKKILEEFIAEKSVEKKVSGVIISSVVPGHNRVLQKALRELTSSKPLFVNSCIETGLTFKIRNPEELGADRIANSVAAYELCGGPVAAVDCGTATTVSVVDANAAYVGGAILPGLGLMSKALAKGAAQLSEVPVTPPKSVIGADTESCILSGLFYGTAGGLEKILCETEYESGFKIRVILTGGYGGLLSPLLKREHILFANLTLEGLKSIYMRNRHA